MLHKALQSPCSAPACVAPAPLAARRSRRKADTLKRSAAPELNAAQTTLSPSIDIQGLQVAFGSQDDRRTVIQGVDLTVKQGTLHMLLGPNGCGKV
jgi:ABC-type transport system involved in cytochrome bd biosynthesis fused ATPase/permease subunit